MLSNPLLSLATQLPLGGAAIVSLGLLLLLAPANWYMLKRFGETEDAIMRLKDARVKVLSEILSGIQIVKLFCWEEKMAERVATVRSREIANLKSFNYALAAMMFFVLSFSNILAVGTFTSFVLMGGRLSAAVVFPSLVLFQNLTWPILVLPDIVSRTSEAIVSLRRLNEFLRRPEVPVQPRGSQQDESPSANATDAKQQQQQREQRGEQYSIVLRNARFAFPPPPPADPEEKEEEEEKDGERSGEGEEEKKKQKEKRGDEDEKTGRKKRTKAARQKKDNSESETAKLLRSPSGATSVTSDEYSLADENDAFALVGEEDLEEAERREQEESNGVREVHIEVRRH